MIYAALTLAQKDLRCFLRDRGALVLSAIVPLMLVTVFGWMMAFAFGGSSGMPKISLHVLDTDSTPESERFVNRLEQFELIRVQRVQAGEDGTDIQAFLEGLVKAGDAHHVLWIPRGFNAASGKNEEAPLRMFRDPGRQMEGRIVQIAVAQAMLTVGGGELWLDASEKLLVDQGVAPEAISQIRGWMSNIQATIAEEVERIEIELEEESSQKDPDDSQSGKSSPIESLDAEPADRVQDESADGLNLEAVWEIFTDAVALETTDVKPPSRPQQVTYQQAQSVAGMSVMMLLFALTSCGSVLLTEREDGTLRRLFAQPISRNAVLLGKFFFVFIVGACQMLVLFLYGEWMFRVGLFRDPITLFVLSGTWVAAGGAFGMFLASVCRSSKQAEGLATLLILLMAALGGCWFPLQMMELPIILDVACKSTMTYWAMTGFQSMLWNQLAWYEPTPFLAVFIQWIWVVVLSVLAVFFYHRNYCHG
jgi:ABC-2 type transport system permease protein